MTRNNRSYHRTAIERGGGKKLYSLSDEDYSQVFSQWCENVDHYFDTVRDQLGWLKDIHHDRDTCYGWYTSFKDGIFLLDWTIAVLLFRDIFWWDQASHQDNIITGIYCYSCRVMIYCVVLYGQLWSQIFY